MAEPQNPESRDWPALAARAVGAAACAAFLLFGSWLLYDVLRASLGWSVAHDTPLLLYMGYLMEAHGFIPYRDFFDMNLLGSYLSYQMIGRYFGFDDAGVRLADVYAICALMVLTAAMVGRLGWRVLWAAPVLFSLFYLREGIIMTLQREFLGLLPIALGTACATALPFVPPVWRAWLAGIAFGVAATVKPHLAVGLPFVVLYLVSEQQPAEARLIDRIKCMVQLAVMSGFGLALPLLAFVGYLLYHGVFEEFMDSAFGYLPLYTSMTGGHSFLPPEERPQYLLSSFVKMGERWPFVVIGFTGLAAGMGNPAHSPAQRRIAALLAALAAAYTVYPVFSGQFWYYHYLPMMYFMAVGAAMVFGPWGPRAPWSQRLVPLFIVLIVLIQMFQPESRWSASATVPWNRPGEWYITQLIQKPSLSFSPLYRHENAVAKGGRVDDLARYMKEHLRPGETVQPLDWTSGVVHAMLRAEVKIATPFIYYFHFFHHPKSEYIQNLRKRFVAELEAARPRFIIWGVEGLIYIQGNYESTRTFPEVTAFIAENYKAVYRRHKSVVYELDDGTLGEASTDDDQRVPETTGSVSRRLVDAIQSRRAVPDLP